MRPNEERATNALASAIASVTLVRANGRGPKLMSTASTRCFPTTIDVPASGTTKTIDAMIAPSVPTTRAARRTGRVWHARQPGNYAEAKKSALGDTGFERGRKGLTHRLELDAVENVLEEAAHDQAFRLPAGETSGHGVEELVAIDPAHRGSVRAADVVRQDLQPRDRNRVRRRRQHQVPVLLVRVRLLRVRLDADHAAPHGR